MNPPFHPLLRQVGRADLPDFSAMTAITFGDIVVFQSPCTDCVLFHELVHAEQYRQVGIERFAEMYVRGFLDGGSYEAIPLEILAFDLTARFEGDAAWRFSVEEEVRTWLTRHHQG